MLIIPSSALSPEEIEALSKFDPNDKNKLLWDDATYFADRRYCTNTHLGKLDEGGPLHLLNHLRYPQPPKEHHIWGSAFHCAVLEPDQFFHRFYAIDDAQKCKEIGGAKPRATNEYKNWLTKRHDDNAGKQCLSDDDFKDIMAIRDKVNSIPQCLELLKNCQKEVVYKDHILGVDVKCKADGYSPGNFGLELKSMRDPATPYKFIKALKDHSYDRQSSFYRDILKVPEYYFIAVEKTYPYTIGLYKISEETYRVGKNKYETGLNMYNHYFGKNSSFNESQFLYMNII